MPHHGRIFTWQKHHGLPMAEEKVELELYPRLDDQEKMLVGVFLRRYVTWCARTRRIRWMQAAGDLFHNLRMTRYPR